MTKTYTIRPLPYSNFTNREFESLMTDSHQVLTSFAKSSKEVGKTKQLRTELSRIYDLFMRYTAASAEAYPEKLHFAKLLKDLNTIRDSKRRLSSPSKKAKTEPAVEVAG